MPENTCAGTQQVKALKWGISCEFNVIEMTELKRERRMKEK